jgi:hypothetical protein
MDNPPDADDTPEMHRRVAWLKPSDRPILAELASYDGWMKPASLALNTAYSQHHVAGRLRELAKRGLVDRHSENIAAYRTNDRTSAFLSDSLTDEELNDIAETPLDDLDFKGDN